ncbi:ACP synthase [Cystobacter ferrugineus]|uniref:ACP synthase n=1 Tax=Cystobacter ferrugineus TaxID=83449 RepID=A0A1L9B974_9BACT|nr:ACP synthase [Cystobacter ferrugineus]OJH38809.1 ACP synthase [Cystobacter ferrugineus]
MSTHPSEWTLRRLHARELPGPESQQAWEHVSSCTECREVMKGLEADQARFEEEVPFDRFAAEVERALRKPPAAPSRPRLNGFLVAVAATVLLVVAVRPLLSPSPSLNRLKGGASAELRIGGDGPQRAVLPGTTEALLPGERVRLGYVADSYRYVMAVSVDDTGEVSALYSEQGMSLPVEAGAGTHWLPESVLFTGTGHERVVLVLSDKPLRVEAVQAAARRIWEAAGGKVAAMSTLGVEGEELHWLLRKP